MERGGRLVGMLVSPDGEFEQSKKKRIVKKEQLIQGEITDYQDHRLKVTVPRNREN